MKELNNKYIELPDEHASEHLARCLAVCLHPSLIIALHGNLGAGKTTIVRAMLRKLGITTAIKSPTFSLVESYSCHDKVIHHFDLYRIAHEEELDYLGFRDYFTQDSICCIEWAEKAGSSLPLVDIHFNLECKGQGRGLQMLATSDAGRTLLAQLMGIL